MRQKKNPKTQALKTQVTNQSNKAIIFDTGSLISFSMNGITDYIRELKKIFNGKFLVTSQVRYEIIDKPMQIKKFELEAIKIKALLDEKVLEMPSSVGVSDKDVGRKTEEIMAIANSTFSGRGRDIKILDLGESSCLALSKLISEKGIRNVIAVDERTTRVLAEKPDNLKLIFEKKMGTKINSKRENYKFFSEFRIIRSAELVYVAYKKGLVKLKDPNTLDALLYAVKFKGAAISGQEIDEIKKIG